MAGEPTEQQIMGLYAVAREEATALAETRASLDATTKRLEALQGAIAREARDSIGNAAKTAVAGVYEVAEASAREAAGSTAKDLRQAAARVTAAANDASSELRGLSWVTLLATLCLGISLGGSVVGWFAWGKIGDQLNTVLNNQGEILQAGKPAAQQRKR
jgi:hypothetical protein